jgi:lipase chaperone LimK
VSLELDHLRDRVPSLNIRLKGGLDRAFFARTARRVERLLARTRARLVLDIEQLNVQHQKHLQALLRRLARYSDRVFIAASSELKNLIAGDLARFNLLLSAPSEISGAQ